VAAAAPEPAPIVVAPRGWASRAPENTLAALRAAAEAEVPWLEVDVQLSADRVPFLFHDRTLERVCGERGALGERTAAEHGRLRAAERGRFGGRFAEEPVARLADLVALLVERPALSAFVEIKRAALERFGHPEVLSRVREVLAPVRERTVLISFSLDFLRVARAAGEPALGPVLERWEERREPLVVDLRPEVVFVDRELLPPRGPLDAPGPLAVYEVPQPRDALALAARGARFVETFAPGELLAGLAALRAEA
jgi:glycerophosphoryl diester phosphodiesterase